MSLAPYVRGSLTSEQAAKAISDSAAPLCRQVLRLIRDHGVNGLTREELETVSGLKGNTIRPRVRTLMDAGLIIASDEVRRTASGQRAQVLITPEFA